jgi:hypothetical protein
MSEPPQPPPGDEAVIEVRLGELKQLFNAMDPAPFWERDLDPNAADYIVESARELRGGPRGLIIHLGREPATAEASRLAREAVQEYFKHRALASRRELRQLLRVGRKSLWIGLLFVGVAVAIGDVVYGLVGRLDYGRILYDSIVIGAWVALWRPLEIFLYDWWPILQEARLYDRLAAMPVDVVAAGERA